MFYEEEREDSPHCPMCLGLGEFIGYLGKISWFRCIQCGINFSVNEQEKTTNTKQEEKQ